MELMSTSMLMKLTSVSKKKKKGQEGGMQDVTGHTQSLSLDNERARMDLTFFSTMHVVM